MVRGVSVAPRTTLEEHLDDKHLGLGVEDDGIDGEGGACELL
jgi:hypothetical protein